MLTLLSPAKKLDTAPVQAVIPPSQPILHSHTEILAKAAKKLSVQDLQTMMKLSDNLAEINAQRFKSFSLDGRSNSAKPAALSFNGNVYEGLDAASLSAADMEFSQDHIRILSGLYGVLRPMDNIQPYRLEMGRKLATVRGENLYKFWGSIIAQNLMDELTGHKQKALVNLASNEYFKAVDKKTITVPVIEAKFLNIKDGEARNLMYYAKRARGLMVRWIIENRVEMPDDLRGFNLEGYAVDDNQSTPELLIFTRQQPPPKTKT
ncbi:MAG: hypothetical protein COA91_05815 [Robiginitomaculum sp.]|nr:MAG: hypothetical protein COA91_05815 [Robiginitomaculum sp.]